MRDVMTEIHHNQGSGRYANSGNIGSICMIIEVNRLNNFQDNGGKLIIDHLLKAKMDIIVIFGGHLTVQNGPELHSYFNNRMLYLAF